MHDECVDIIPGSELIAGPASQLTSFDAGSPAHSCLESSRAQRLQEGLPFGSVLDRAQPVDGAASFFDHSHKGV
jgi:hypothetical protein